MLSKLTRKLYQGVQQVPRANKRCYSQRKLLGKYKTTPVDLFRIQNGATTKLREFTAQQKKNSTAYDVKAGPDGLIHPKNSEFFEGPSGASLKPLCPFIFEIVSHSDKMVGRDPRIYLIPKGTKVPDNLIILHESPEHYSLQTTEPVKLSGTRPLISFKR